jgi:CBS domain containing-hemolysin-like protein
MNPDFIILLSMLFSAFFSGMEIAFLTANKFRIEIERKQGKLTARILSYFLHKPSWYIGAVLTGNNIALVVYGIYISAKLEPILMQIFPQAGKSEAFLLTSQTLISTFIILIVGEFIPKVLFRINPNETLSLFAVPMIALYGLFYPVVYVILKFSNALLSAIFKINISENKIEFGRVDLDHYVKNIQPAKGENDELNTELEMFQAALDFGKIKVRNCMIPRPEIVAVEQNTSIEKLRQLFSETRLSRILIYRDTPDNIIGFVHSFEMFKNPTDIMSVLLPVTIFPESTPALEVLRHFTAEHRSVAVVVDEHGLTSGMVTVEDVIEEIFGEIQDEHDLDQLTETRISDNEYLFSASLEIDYLNEKYGFNIPTGDYETLAGFILHHHPSIPSADEEIVIEPFYFKIKAVKGSRIDTLTLKIKQG